MAEEQVERAVDGFNNTETGSIREAIRLGFIMLHGENVKPAYRDIFLQRL